MINLDGFIATLFLMAATGLISFYVGYVFGRYIEWKEENKK